MHDSDKKDIDILLHLLLKTEAGKMLEWLKRHAWKACKRLKRFTGSNPVLSANKKPQLMRINCGFFYFFSPCFTHPYRGKASLAIRIQSHRAVPRRHWALLVLWLLSHRPSIRSCDS